jgi:cobalt-zinc-cadmium efflux system outer membrane protein
MGCAARDYTPPLLPTFMGEDPPAQLAPAPAPPAAVTPGLHLPTLGWAPLTAPPAQPRAAVQAGSRAGPAGEAAQPQPVVRVLSVTQATGADSPATSARGPAAEESRSPAQPGTAGITLDEAILATLRTDPKLGAALEGIRQARADLLTSSLPPNPTLTGDGIFLPLRRITPAKPGGPPQTDWTLGYPIDWFLFGKRAAAVESARLGVDVSAADYADQVRQRIANVVAAYYDVLEARALDGLARQDLDALRRVEAITAERVKLGGIGAVELDRARLAVYDARREARNREVTLAAARSKFRAFLGPAGSDPALDVAGDLEVPNPLAAPPLQDALALAEQARPDIISLRRQIAKAEAAVHAEQTKGCPTLTPTLALSEQFQHSLGVPDMPTWDVSANLSLPLFDRNQGNVAKARSTQVQTALTLRAQLNDLRAEVEQTVDAFRAAYANVTANDPEQLRTARSVRDRIEQGFKAGGKTLLEVLDAERAYRDANRTYILGQSSYWHSLHRLNAAVGKQVLR